MIIYCKNNTIMKVKTNIILIYLFYKMYLKQNLDIISIMS